MPSTVPDLRVRGFAGSIESPNPFWLASAPPTNTGEMIARAFDAGWGGAVWKTIGPGILRARHNLMPRLASRRHHQRRDHRVIRIALLHLCHLAQVGLDAAIADELNIVEAHHA